MMHFFPVPQFVIFLNGNRCFALEEHRLCVCQFSFVFVVMVSVAVLLSGRGTKSELLYMNTTY